MQETNSTVQVLTAGGAGVSRSGGTSGGGSKNTKRRNHGRRRPHGGNKGKANKGGSGDDDHDHSEDEINIPPTGAKEEDQNNPSPAPERDGGGSATGTVGHHLEIEGTDSGDEDGVVDVALKDPEDKNSVNKVERMVGHTPYSDTPKNGVSKPGILLPPHPKQESAQQHQVFWLVVCFLGIMASFVCYGLLLEYTTSGGRKLHELSFLFVTSGLYTLTAAAGRYVRDETPTTIPPARFAVLGLTSMGSTFCSVRSLRCVTIMCSRSNLTASQYHIYLLIPQLSLFPCCRYVIFPIQVLAKSCKPVPVMLMGALMGKVCPNLVFFAGLIPLDFDSLFRALPSHVSKSECNVCCSDTLCASILTWS